MSASTDPIVASTAPIHAVIPEIISPERLNARVDAEYALRAVDGAPPSRRTRRRVAVALLVLGIAALIGAAVWLAIIAGWVAVVMGLVLFVALYFYGWGASWLAAEERVREHHDIKQEVIADIAAGVPPGSPRQALRPDPAPR